MIQYGANKATEITKKQVNAIYAAAKRGDIKVERWLITEFYNVADYYGYDDNHTVEECERGLKLLINDLFSRDYKAVQKRIDEYTAELETRYSRKFRETADRSLI